MAKYTMPFDELNVLRQTVSTAPQLLEDGEAQDFVHALLLMAYIYGTEAANDMLGTEIAPDRNEAEDAIYKRIAGKDFEERVREYVASGDYESIIRVAETDSIRVYNDAILNTGKKSKLPNINKTWETAGDDKVRDTHEYLEGSTVPIDALFYTYDGDSAMYPGDFTLPENNCNCRCNIVLSQGDGSEKT